LVIFAKQIRGRLFVPIAWLFIILFIYMTNRNSPGSALVSIWMPHVFLFCFIFFATASALVACGNIRYLPLAMLSGMMLVHAHVAQALFVFSLTFLAGANVVLLHRRTIGVLLKRERKYIAISVLLIALFMLPIVLDISVHRPNNIAAIRSYMHAHRGQQNSWKTSWKYFFSFLAHIDNPEVVLKRTRPQLTVLAMSDPYVRSYWSFYFGSAVAGVLLWIRKRNDISAFVKVVALQTAVISLLFLFWGSRISGELYAFNGFFIYSVQLFAFLIVAALISEALPVEIPQAACSFLACTAILPVLLVPAAFRHVYTGSQRVQAIVTHLSPIPAAVRLSFDTPEWPVAIGVASRLQRLGHKFCTNSDWEFMVGRANSCSNFDPGTPSLKFTTSSVPAEGSCTRVWEDGEGRVDLCRLN
jgi:hypothetical protein